MIANMFHEFKARLVAAAVDDAGMSTVEYSAGYKTYRERIPRWLLQRRSVPRLFGR